MPKQEKKQTNKQAKKKKTKNQEFLPSN